MTDLNLNQFSQVPVKGQLDLQISKSGVISGVVDASQATALVAGQPVKLYASNTGAEVKFVAAAETDVAIGHVVLNVKKASPEAGDAIEVAGNFGPVMWLEAGETITPGERVENDDADDTIQAVSGGKCRGIAIDYATSGNLTRVILCTPVTAAS
jgi:hypothetical protein